MISYLLLLISSLIYLYPKKSEISTEAYYSLIFSALVSAQLILGFISLILIHLNISKFPLLIISSLIFTLNIIIKSNTIYIFNQIIDFIQDEIKRFFKVNLFDSSSKKIFIVIILFLTLLIFSAIGPINHPDAADYHVGYPYQYFLRGGFFIDGGLTQGLLGIGDYANLAFIQEKTTWMIRFIQIINLPLILLFLSRKTQNNFFLIAFISVPTFIQWSTIGKPLFLGETTFICLYLLWKEDKSPYNLKLLIFSIIACIGYKISSLLIIFPVLIDIVNYFFKKYNLKENITKEIKYVIKNKLFLFSLIIFISLLINRTIITGNFAYPLLTSIFNKNNIVINNFSELIMNYQRDGLFFLRVFIPTNISDLGSALGPSILFIFANIWITKLKNSDKKNNDIFYITNAQIILLMFFCQGRADYYSSPLILVIYQANQIGSLIKFLKFRLIFKITILIQVLIISSFIFFSIGLNLLSLIDFQRYMEESAYGYNIARQVDKSSYGNFLIEERNTRLFYPKNYIERYKMKECILKNDQPFCFNKYEINQVIANKNYEVYDKSFDCRLIDSVKGSRNLFNRRKYKLKFCSKKKL